MILNCFFEVKTNNLPGFNNNMDITTIYKIFLNSINQSNGKIAVSFPEWNEKNIGTSIRFFANEEYWGLLKFMQDLQLLKDLSNRYLIHVSEICLVPDNVKTHLRFFRNRSIDKQSPSYISRMERRMISNNSNFDKENCIKKNIAINKDFHYIMLEKYRIYISRELAEIDFNSQKDLKFSGYGFAPKGLGIPDF